jgi:hypothetical protein
MSFSLFILGNGRAGYLDHTISSWEANLKTQPKYKILFDDSGNKDYVNYLNKKYGNRFTIVPINSEAVGQQKALVFIFNYLKELDTEYYLQLEEDWVLNRPLDVVQIMEAMRGHDNIIQMRLPRTVWYTQKHYFDLMYGSHMSWQQDGKGANFVQKSNWFEKRGKSYFWTHNPNLFPKKILDYTYPETKGGIDHEQLFGLELYKNKNYVVGYWAKNFFDAYVTHIGIHDDALENKVNAFIQKRK